MNSVGTSYDASEIKYSTHTNSVHLHVVLENEGRLIGAVRLPDVEPLVHQSQIAVMDLHSAQKNTII